MRGCFVESRNARLGERRDRRQQRRTPIFGHGERTQPARLHGRQRSENAEHSDLHLTGERISERGAGSLVRNVYDIDSGFELQ